MSENLSKPTFFRLYRDCHCETIPTKSEGDLLAAEFTLSEANVLLAMIG